MFHMYPPGLGGVYQCLTVPELTGTGMLSILQDAFDTIQGESYNPEDWSVGAITTEEVATALSLHHNIPLGSSVDPNNLPPLGNRFFAPNRMAQQAADLSGGYRANIADSVESIADLFSGSIGVALEVINGYQLQFLPEEDSEIVVSLTSGGVTTVLPAAQWTIVGTVLTITEAAQNTIEALASATPSGGEVQLTIAYIPGSQDPNAQN